jgi:hypothetical protein
MHKSNHYQKKGKKTRDLYRADAHQKTRKSKEK